MYGTNLFILGEFGQKIHQRIQTADILRLEFFILPQEVFRCFGVLSDLHLLDNII